MAALASNMVPHHHHHFSHHRSTSSTATVESTNSATTDGSVSMDSASDHCESPHQLQLRIDNDQNSCSSNDTVLSVGNETPVQTSSATAPDQQPLSFKNIESHLNAISQITNSTLNPELLRNINSKKSPSSMLNNSVLLSPSSSPSLINHRRRLSSTSSISPSSTKSVPGSPINVPELSPIISGENHNHHHNLQNNDSFFFNHHHQKLVHHHHHHNQVNNNNNNNDGGANNNNNNGVGGSLKFSIDNILKADFGRISRITDPINIRKCKPAPKSKLIVSSSTPAAAVAENSTLLLEENSKNCGVGKGSIAGGVSSIAGPVDLSKSELPPGTVTSSSSASGNNSSSSSSSNNDKSKSESGSSQPMLWPAWVYCTRYSDRPSSGPRTRRVKKPGTKPSSSSSGGVGGGGGGSNQTAEEKRPRTAFSGAQLARLKHEFAENRYLTERRRQQLSAELGLNEAQIKIWFQNKRAKIKKASGQKNPLALQLMAQGLYNHSTIPLSKEEEELQEMHNSKNSNSGSPDL